MAVNKFLGSRSDYAWYVTEVCSLMVRLQGTNELEAYGKLFPIERPDARAHYQILNDKTNRRIMVVIYKDKISTLDDLARQLSLSVREIKGRIDFFVANGMDRNYVPK